MLDAVPALRHPQLWQDLGRALLRDGYTASEVTHALSLPGWNAESMDCLYWQLSIAAPEPLSSRARFFLHGNPVRRSHQRYLLPQLTEALGLLEQTEVAVRSRRSIVPLTNTELVCADVPRVAVDEPESVFLPDSSTLALRRVQPHYRVGRHLDLGSGGGAVALAAAPWCKELHLIDVNERAGPMARATFALSGRPQPHVWTGTVTDAPMVEPVDRLSFVLPLLVPWEGMGPAPVHTLAADDLLLEETFATLPLLLAPGGIALLFCQCWTPSGSPAEILDAAFGDRPWRGGLWWEAEEESLEGPVKVGVIAVQADHRGGWTEALNEEEDLPHAWWWPALCRDLALD